MGESEDRTIYYQTKNNPYAFGNYESILQEGFGAFIQSIDQIIVEFQNLKKLKNGFFEYGKDKQRLLELFLRQIPHNAFYTKDDIEEANILLISNEPGLTNCYDLYKDFFKDELDLRIIATGFNDAMMSWLTMNKFMGNEVNGDIIPESSNVAQFKFGKIGYFLPECTNVTRVIHLDLFPYAQSNGKDLNDRNKKKIVSESIVVDGLTIPNKNGIVEHIIDTNLATIKTFIKDKNKKKFILIIGNRVIPRLINSDVVMDNNILISKVLEHVLTENDINLDIRISYSWPSKCENIAIYAPVLREKKISFKKINKDAGL